MDRTGSFQAIADNLDNKLTQSQVLIDFLSKHFMNLEEHKQYVNNSVAEVGHSISDTFKELKEHIQNSSKAVKDFTVDEIDLLGKVLSENKTNLANLSNLQFLEKLNKDVSQFKNDSASQGERMKFQIDELNKKLSKSIQILEHIEQNALLSWLNRIVSFFRRLFGFDQKSK